MSVYDSMIQCDRVNPVSFYTKVLNMGHVGNGIFMLYILYALTLWLTSFFVPVPVRWIHFLWYCEVQGSGGISCRSLWRETEGAKNASTVEAETLNHLWRTDLYITLNIKRQYLASVSQTSDSAEHEDSDRSFFSLAEELSPAINGSSVPSITYFWLVGD